MTTDPIQFRLDNIERARQHQNMRAQYPAYREFLEWIAGKIKALDEVWFTVDDETATASQFRGQRLAMKDVQDQLNGALNMDIAAEAAKVEAMRKEAQS